MISRDSQTTVELSEYEQNRARFTSEDLETYRGQWVAFSLDGKRVVAADPLLTELSRKIRAVGEAPESVALECFPKDENFIRSGVELH